MFQKIRFYIDFWIKGVSKFKKMLYFLNKKQKFMASLEMLDSLWYSQTPERVKNLIKNYTKK